MSESSSESNEIRSRQDFKSFGRAMISLGVGCTGVELIEDKQVKDGQPSRLPCRNLGFFQAWGCEIQLILIDNLI